MPDWFCFHIALQIEVCSLLIDNETTAAKMTQAKILFVDDEPLLRLTVGSDLQDAGYLVKTAENGHQACAELAENSYDLVLTDLVMEGIDGMQVLQEAKRCDPTCGVILMTGYGDMDSVIEALRCGADAPAFLKEIGSSRDDVKRLIAEGVVGPTEWVPV